VDLGDSAAEVLLALLDEDLPELPHPTMASPSVKRTIISIDFRTSPPESKVSSIREPKILL